MNNGKVRIYELSKDLNVENKDIINICEQLNISVKSHSSTITESQAERIRAIATRTEGIAKRETSTDKSKNNDSNGRLNKPKTQQILEIRSRTEQANTKENKGEGDPSDSTPTLVAPPRPPAAKSKPAPPSRPQPPKRQSESAPIAEKEVTPVEREETVLEEVEEVESPELVKPPQRPSKPEKIQHLAPKKVAKRSEIKPATETSPEEDRNIEVIKPEPKPKPKLELKAPPRVKRAVTATPPPQQDQDEEPDQGVDLEAPDQEDDDSFLQLNDKPKPKLKRPDAHPRKQEWEEEEEEESKAKSPKKRRTKLVIEDDDDEFASDNNLPSTFVTASQSIARPPKPSSMGSQKPAAQQKKPAPKPGKKEPGQSGQSKSDNRRREKKAVPELPEKIVLEGSLTVRELADMLNITETEIIRQLFFKGMPVNITQTLDLETATMVAEDLEVEVEIPEKVSAATKTEMIETSDLDLLQSRPPVVTIMGHVDHGKTTLLDSIRKTKVAQGEAGGITQHIGAYHVDVEHAGKTQQVVFLDTPGHEAFTAMRARGTKVTDIAILVVAADDGVQPQTKEAISHARAAGVPLIVAINKVDKEGAEPDRIKQELTDQGLVPEEWGGDVIMVPVSALQGENLDTLLEMIILVSEVEELSANPNRLAKGTVIEANLDKAKGPVATFLIQNGTLRVGDTLVAGSAFGKIRAMIDDRAQRVDQATPSFAVEVLGMSEVPSAGDEFEVFATEKEARATADQRTTDKRETYLQRTMSSRRVTLTSLSAKAQEGELKELNLILKADVQGSVEAILGSLEQLPQDEVQVRVLLAAPGEVTETDVDLAAASGAVIIGFNTTLASGSRAAADHEGVDIRDYEVIYKLLDDIEGAMEGLLEPEEVEEPLGEAEVRAVFSVGRGAVAGCYVRTGKVLRNKHIRVRRGNEVVYKGNLDSLKRMKDDVKEVNAGFECGINADKFNDWKEGDSIEAYQLVMKRRTLATR